MKKLSKGLVINEVRKEEGKVIYELETSDKNLKELYNAMMQLYPDYKKLEFQCDKKQLKEFKKIVIGAFVLEACVNASEIDKEKRKTK